MSAPSPLPVSRRIHWIFWISLPPALLGILAFPFHLKSFALSLVGGAIYATPFVFRGARKESADAFHFLAIMIGGAFCLLASRSYPRIDAHSDYYTFAAFALAAAIGSGVAIIFRAVRKKANAPHRG